MKILVEFELGSDIFPQVEIKLLQVDLYYWKKTPENWR